jgi:hypothetical protein
LKTAIYKFTQSKYLPILTFVSLAVLWLLYRITIALNQTPELLNGETNNIWNALKVISGKPIYTNPEAIPYEIFQYTPISQLPIIFFAWFENNFFPSQDFIFTLGAGRILSLVYNILTAFVIFKILKNQLKVRTFLAWFGSLIFLCLLPHHFFAIRPDSMALLFTITGIYFFTKAYFQDHQTSFILSGVILSFSFFVKQDAFLISGAFGIVLLLSKNIRGLILFSASLFFTLGILLFIAPVFLGSNFYNSVFGGVALEMKFSQFSYVLLRYFTFYYLLAALVIFSISIVIKNRNEHGKHLLFFFITFIVTFCFAALTSFKVGSHFNYYELPTIISLLFIVFSVDKKNQLTKNETTLIVGTICIVFTVSLHFLYFQYYHYTSPFLKNKVAQNFRTNSIANNQKIFNELNNSNLNICSYDTRSRIILAKKVILPNSEFYGISKFSYRDFSNSDPKKRIDIIILPIEIKLKDTDLGRFVGDFNTYEIWKQTPDLEFYRPKNEN